MSCQLPDSHQPVSSATLYADNVGISGHQKPLAGLLNTRIFIRARNIYRFCPPSPLLPRPAAPQVENQDGGAFQRPFTAGLGTVSQEKAQQTLIPCLIFDVASFKSKLFDASISKDKKRLLRL
jgi:hypothetical protein